MIASNFEKIRIIFNILYPVMLDILCLRVYVWVLYKKYCNGTKFLKDLSDMKHFYLFCVFSQGC